MVREWIESVALRWPRTSRVRQEQGAQIGTVLVIYMMIIDTRGLRWLALCAQRVRLLGLPCIRMEGVALGRRRRAPGE